MLKRIQYILLLATLMLGGAAYAGDLEPTMGEDGIYHYDWYHQSFLELEDDITEALDEGKILMVKFDQVGCLYCEKLALETLAEPAINAYVREHFVVVQLDLYGNRDVTDLDGEILPENEMARKWGVLFTPTIYFIGKSTDATTLPQASNATMPGSFGKLTFLGFLQWVREGNYDGGEPFQKYLVRRMDEIRSEMEAARAASS